MADRKSGKTRSKEPSDRTAIAVTPRRPEVIVEFSFDHGLLFVSVRNIGDRPAVKISVNFNKKILGLNGTKNISGLPLFKNIEFLGPQREIVTLLDSCDSYFKRKQPTKVSAKISYIDPENRKYAATINHDLGIYRELVYINSPPSHDIEQEEVS